MSLFDTKFQTIDAMFGEESHSSYYSNPNNYINSTWLKTQLKELFKSKEKYSYYLKCGDVLMGEANALTFSIESHCRTIEAFYSINKLCSDVMKNDEFSSLSKESQNAIKKLLSHSAEQYKWAIVQDYDGMSTEQFAGQKAGESKGIKRVFELIGQAIKKIILAIANFFKGIFVHIRSFFRKFTYSAMQKYFAAAVQAAKANPQLTVTLPKYSKSGFSKNLAKFLQEVPKKTADIQKNYTEIIKMVNEFANKKGTGIIDSAVFQSKLTVAGRCVEGTAKSLLNSGVKINKNGQASMEMTSQMNKLIFGSETGVGKMAVKAAVFLKQVQAAGLDKINMDQVLNAISKGMTDLQAKTTEANKAFDKVKANVAAQSNGVVRGLLQFCQAGFQNSLAICRMAIGFYKLASGVLYQAYKATVTAVVKIAKSGGKVQPTPAAKGGKQPSKKNSR